MEPRARFTSELRAIQDDVVSLGRMVGVAIDQSVEALKGRDTDWARMVIHNDIAINARRFAIEERCMKLLATQAPLAVDLRFIASALNIITDLERMGDHAEGICKINIMLGEEPLVKSLIDIPRMAAKANDMLSRSLEALVARDIEKAKAVSHEDDEVDALHDQVVRELISFMIEDPRTIQRALYLTWVSHNLERIADRVTNICERVVYIVTGEMEEINASKN
jgi:phosphate transport system protein